MRILLAIVLALCAGTAGVAEVIVRSAIDGRITAAARKHLTGPVSVGIGATPALLDAVTGNIPQVTIQAPSDTMCDLKDIAATTTLSGLHRTDSGAAVQGVRADITLTTQTFTDLLGSYRTATVTPDPSAADLRIGMGPGGILQVAETAQLRGNTLEFRPARVSLPGRPVPQAIQRTITSKLTIHRTLSRLPLNLAPRSAAVTSNGVQIQLTAGPATLARAGTETARHCRSGFLPVQLATVLGHERERAVAA